MMLTCVDVAKYFLVLVDRESGDLITQLKLQKLVYFAQGVSLRFRNKPLFEEPIEAYEHGPVMPELRKTFGVFKNLPLPEPIDVDFSLYNDEEKALIYKVYSEYGEHTASYLRNITHGHSIWNEARHRENKVMSIQDIQKCFQKEVKLAETFLEVSDEDKKKMECAEDVWWMNYDSGVPSEDITDELIKDIKHAR